ncbi:hypothetical protein LEP1GSC062_3503 [Leptospira alexanderi serovar Manhao 3 str. L 60]|uniref:Uncharacterized protein n=1 Tax=Leptospira alexanderi serovar Manhao 3 str. L 60 TaxID=1049759 RepID=V6HWU4_9LEPT|nr:hypothetical protein LEP1GSC062_3503 [Leptospira alexanderi serovar Manhao 3 str. L 60]
MSFRAVIDTIGKILILFLPEMRWLFSTEKKENGQNQKLKRLRAESSRPIAKVQCTIETRNRDGYRK